MSFPNRALLERHVRSDRHLTAMSRVNDPHVNPRPFKCDDCGIAFRIHGHLAKHLRSKAHVGKLEGLKPSRDEEESGDVDEDEEIDVTEGGDAGELIASEVASDCGTSLKTIPVKRVVEVEEGLTASKNELNCVEVENQRGEKLDIQPIDMSVEFDTVRRDKLTEDLNRDRVFSRKTLDVSTVEDEKRNENGSESYGVAERAPSNSTFTCPICQKVVNDLVAFQVS